MLKLWVVEYQNAHWCGGQACCVVWAKDEQDAEDRSEFHREDYQYDLFSDQYADEPDYDEAPYSTVDNVELLEGSRIEEFYADPGQRAAFYPCVNPEDEPK